MTDLKITPIRSTAYRLPNQRRVVKAFGLGKINNPVVLLDNAAARGILMKIAYLISVEEINK